MIGRSRMKCTHCQKDVIHYGDDYWKIKYHSDRIKGNIYNYITVCEYCFNYNIPFDTIWTINSIKHQKPEPLNPPKPPKVKHIS